MAKVRTSKVLARFDGGWVVTTYGLENEQRYYPIEKSRVHEQDWERHMNGKNWCQGVALMYFAMALSDARQRFPLPKKTAAAGGRK
jgi:hypothetical protein